MIQFAFLTADFFADYAACKEIEKKPDRPHVQVTLLVGGVLFCIPMRSHITHPHVLWTDKANGCGLDFSKAVVITDPARYIDTSRLPHIRSSEFKVLKQTSEYEIRRRLLTYISVYKDAKAHPDIPRNRTLLQCSTLQYFEQYI